MPARPEPTETVPESVPLNSEAEPEPVPLDSEVDQFAAVCNRVYSLMHRNRSSLTAATAGTEQLSESQLAIITPLAEHGAMAVGRLAERARVSQPTATRALKQLEARGIVARGRITGDDRTVLVNLTARGADEWHRASERMRAFQRRALARIPAERRAVIVASLAELAQAIDRTS